MGRITRNEAWRLLDRVHEVLFPIFWQAEVALRLAEAGAAHERIMPNLNRVAYDLGRLLAGLDETLLYGEPPKNGTQTKLQFEGGPENGTTRAHRGGEAHQYKAVATPAGDSFQASAH